MRFLDHTISYLQKTNKKINDNLIVSHRNVSLATTYVDDHMVRIETFVR